MENNSKINIKINNSLEQNEIININYLLIIII